MRRGVSTLAFTAVLLLCYAQGWAQQASKDVQITGGPKIEHVVPDSAVVSWTTNVPSSSTVRYGTDRDKLDQQAQAPWGGTTHRVEIKNLKPGTTYYFQVVSAHGQGTGTGALSRVEELRTPGEAAQSGQQAVSQPQKAEQQVEVVAGPVAQKVTDNSAQVWWQTNRPSSTIVKYGTDPKDLKEAARKPWGEQSHYVEIKALKPDTTYYVSVQATDGRELASSSFKTAAANSAQRGFDITNGPFAEYVSPTEVVVAWTTHRPASSVVFYGTDRNNLNQRAEAPWGQQTHRVRIRNLQPNTQYWFRVESGQAQGTGESARSAEFPIRTLARGEQAMAINPR